MYNHEELKFVGMILNKKCKLHNSVYNFDRLCSLRCYLIPIILDYNIAGLITPLDS